MDKLVEQLAEQLKARLEDNYSPLAALTPDGMVHHTTILKHCTPSTEMCGKCPFTGLCEREKAAKVMTNPYDECAHEPVSMKREDVTVESMLPGVIYRNEPEVKTSHERLPSKVKEAPRRYGWALITSSKATGELGKFLPIGECTKSEANAQAMDWAEVNPGHYAYPIAFGKAFSNENVIEHIVTTTVTDELRGVVIAIK